jgi:hypothetical protein
LAGYLALPKARYFDAEAICSEDDDLGQPFPTIIINTGIIAILAILAILSIQ